MGALYFFLSLVSLFLAVGVVRPRWLGATVGLLASIPLLCVSVFVPQWIIFSGLWALGFAHLGALSGLGAAGFGLHILAWALLLSYLLRLRDTLPILDGKPLGDAEIPFFATEQAGSFAVESGFPSLWPNVVLRTPTMKQVEVISDVVYRQTDGLRLRMDIYRPKTRGPGLLPSLLFVHGGAWIVGTKRQSPFLLYDLAARGHVVFSIDYRLAPRFPLPAAIHDCKAAVAWISKHGAQYGAAPVPVAIGNSAGGHLAAMLACSGKERSLQPGFEQEDCRVAAAVVLYGLTDFVGLLEHKPHPIASYLLEEMVFCRRYREDPETFLRAQPTSYLSADLPPILLIHGQHDVMVSIRQTHRFYERLKAAGASVVHLAEFPLAPHAFDLAPTPLQQRAERLIAAFLASLRPPNTKQNQLVK